MTLPSGTPSSESAGSDTCPQLYTAEGDTRTSTYGSYSLPGLSTAEDRYPAYSRSAVTWTGRACRPLRFLPVH